MGQHWGIAIEDPTDDFSDILADEVMEASTPKDAPEEVDDESTYYTDGDYGW